MLPNSSAYVVLGNGFSFVINWFHIWCRRTLEDNISRMGSVKLVRDDDSVILWVVLVCSFTRIKVQGYFKYPPDLPLRLRITFFVFPFCPWDLEVVWLPKFPSRHL